jgi:membrane-bound lytic murein transglycosylase D
VASSNDKIEPTSNEQSSGPSYDGLEDPDRFPEISENKRRFGNKPQFVNINGIPGIIGKEDQTTAGLAIMAGITEMKFSSYNEILPHESISTDQVYYFKKKKTKAKVHYHTVQHGETLWGISQKYGVRMSKLVNKNRLKDIYDIEPGMVLWLRYVRPSNEEIAYQEVKEAIIASEQAENFSNSVDVEEFEEEKVQHGSPLVVSAPPNVIVEDLITIDTDLETFDSESETITITHEVKAKETLYAISNLYHVEVMDIINWNDLNIADGLRIGQNLELIVERDWQNQVETEEQKPSSDMKNNDFFEHRVQVGDTMYAIANRYGVTVKDIQLWNDKENISVTIGEKIWIKR